MTLRLFALALLLSAPAFAQDPAPADRCKDRTGIRWVRPFKAALAKAKASKRLLLIKPIAFGTDSKGGW